MLSLSVLNRRVSIETDSAIAHTALEAAYGALETSRDGSTAALSYTIQAEGDRFILRRGDVSLASQNLAHLLYSFDKDLTIELQRQRPDLYFLHAGVVEFRGRALALVAPSGAGKSTFVWALLHHGYRYLSDELAPIELDALAVHPYPRALCLKREPPRDALPGATLRTAERLHVPTHALPSPHSLESVKLGAIFFVDHHRTATSALSGAVQPAEAAIRLYANALNPLAHANDGLEAAAAIASNVSCFNLNTGDLERACRTATELMPE